MRKWWWVAALALLLDQLSKSLARMMAAPVTLIPGLVGLRYCENTGMAFSLFSGQAWLLGVLSAALLLCGWLFLRRLRLGSLGCIAVMLILGGAVSNMLDRFLMGYVTDMIEILLFRFAIFNLADAFLCVGCVLLALSMVLHPEEWEEKKR